MSPNNLRANRQQGFTIVELLIVIVVIGILVAISIVTYQGVQRRAIGSTMQHDAAIWYQTMSIYYVNTGSYSAFQATRAAGTTYKVSGNNVYTDSYTSTSSGIVYTATFTNPGSTDAYVISIGGSATNNTPLITTNPYITTPLSGATYDIGACGPASGIYANLYSGGGGSPTPSIQWQIMSPKNTTAGTWSNLASATTANYIYSPGTYNYGDYQLFRVLYTSAGNTTTSPSIQENATNGC